MLAVQACGRPISDRRTRTVSVLCAVLQGFFCDSEGDFDDLCTSLRSLCPDSKGVMFEVCTHRPPYLQYNPDFFASSPPGKCVVLGVLSLPLFFITSR